MTDPAPRRATAADIDEAAAVVAAAFHELPPAAWLVPDQGEREKLFPDYFRILLAHAITYGEVYTIADGSAVAVWFSNVGEPAPPPEDYDRRLESIVGGHAERFRMFDAAIDEHHPHEPHHYLALLACIPSRQGNGLGSTLLRAHHRLLDERAVPAYLEASTLRSRELYLRHGYRPHGEPYRLPGGPPMWPMWRQPQPVE